MNKRLFILKDSDVRKHCAYYIMNEVPTGYAVTIQEAARNLEQNALMWSLLAEVSAQVVWHGRKLDSESWKHIFSSSLKKQDVVPNLDGTGFVVLGQSTSKMSKSQFAELIELIFAFGAQHDVKFKGTSND